MKYKVNFKALSTKQKIEYVWDYYKWHVVILVFVISIIVSTVQNAINYKEPLLNIIMLNSYGATMNTEDHGFEAFFERYDYDSFDGAVEIKKDIFFSLQEELNYEDYESYEVLFPLLVGQEYQMILGTGEKTLNFLNQGFLSDLSMILSKDILERYKDQLVYFEDEGKKYPCAIILSNNQWLAENNYYDGECYVGILNQENISEVVIDFTEFLLSYSGSCE